MQEITGRERENFSGLNVCPPKSSVFYQCKVPTAALKILVKIHKVSKTMLTKRKTQGSRTWPTAFGEAAKTAKFRKRPAVSGATSFFILDKKRKMP
ncbi:MAG: hypothetical protein IPH31_24635 [Lewinellaceae bacterium]|nr:hypothetical protein [Lewinellaceae bacterium]